MWRGFSACLIAVLVLLAPSARSAQPPEYSILLYHRLGPVVSDSMTIRTDAFRSEIRYLVEHHYPIVPLRRLVAYVRGEGPAPPAHAVCLTADDGHASIFTEMLPVVREFQVPVTLFIYPSAISNASYAMTWEQLATLRDTGLFDIQSHTYWHPNFKIEKRRLSDADYRAFLAAQLTKPRATLKRKLGVDATLLAWPFGIVDDELIAAARDAGYVAAFTLERRMVTASAQPLAMPRFLVSAGFSGRTFPSMLPGESP